MFKNIPTDLLKIIKGYKDQIDHEEIVNNHKVNFNDCLKDITTEYWRGKELELFEQIEEDIYTGCVGNTISSQYNDLEFGCNIKNINNWYGFTEREILTHFIHNYQWYMDYDREEFFEEFKYRFDVDDDEDDEEMEDMWYNVVIISQYIGDILKSKGLHDTGFFVDWVIDNI